MESFVSLLIALLAAPLFPGVINRTKAVFAGKKGPPLLMKYYTLAKLFRKGSVYSTSSSYVFKMGPTVYLAAAIMALLFYLADPIDTLCLVTSTTIEGAKKRIFKDIKRLWRKEFRGKLVDGKGQIKGINEEGDIDDSRGISIIPCANVGDPSSRFIGIKAKNMHVFYDELSE